MTTQLQTYLTQNKEIFWDVADLSVLSDTAIVERFLQYGDWKNIVFLREYYGTDTFQKHYQSIISKKRHSLSAKTLNFFNRYLNV
ncbi:hypothetical protein MK079_01525 [Candidatus Gracilibacteria bacterium]|nr:hypothetical protein [Candidatus Gracilibacteria bacterium]